MATNLAHVLLRRAHTPDTAEHIFNERVVQKPLLLRPSSPEPSARALRRRTQAQRNTRAKKRSSLKPQPLSAAQKRQLGLLEIPKEQTKYDIYAPLHNLWLSYMREILGLERKACVSAASAGQILASADMHGAMLEVVRSRCVSRVGIKGIVVRDTKFVFDIITKGNVIKSVPKEHTTFRFEIPLPAVETEQEPKPLAFEILGEQFQNRAPERANKKWKMHFQPDI
ncbi:ribonuclease-like protein P complex subunit Pop4 [Lindgomyces ingoldianus]|uniref:Ribonuclease-like protein P complex subunit Pop4 n=1 Tax=Lindgomyces ingoldianus TaxID=673940 RepID=A0ACB6R3D3_9PLEO|nr:ribonuclease-like protein P complex subunit Pop4 [Lindgomyces ingoldianus]KAF2473759.1 ribonuclease-like protein P complex subunit Pop4 [Lindgomyces ingoldianus]